MRTLTRARSSRWSEGTGGHASIRPHASLTVYQTRDTQIVATDTAAAQVAGDRGRISESEVVYNALEPLSRKKYIIFILKKVVSGPMLIVKLRAVMEDYRLRHGRRMTYQELAEKTGLALSTIKAIGSDPTYHPTLTNVEKLCLALEATPGEMMEIVQNFPETSD